VGKSGDTIEENVNAERKGQMPVLTDTTNAFAATTGNLECNNGNQIVIAEAK
jgi:hypothetical protein